MSFNSFASFQTDAEFLAREHEVGRASLTEVLRFSRRERDAIVEKVDELKSKQLLRRDRQVLVKMIEDRQREFDACWQERKATLTSHGR